MKLIVEEFAAFGKFKVAFRRSELRVREIELSRPPQIHLPAGNTEKASGERPMNTFSKIALAFAILIVGISTSCLGETKSKSPVRLASFQVGMAALSSTGEVNGVYGPYAAFSPMLDFGRLGLRTEISSSLLHVTPTDFFNTLGAAGYVRFPITFFSSSHAKRSGLSIGTDAFDLELGGGMQTWWARSGGWFPQFTANFVLNFHWYLDRLTLGYTLLYPPSGQTGEIRVGLGFALF